MCFPKPVTKHYCTSADGTKRCLLIFFLNIVHIYLCKLSQFLIERRPDVNVYTTRIYLLDVAMAQLTLHKGKQSYNKWNQYISLVTCVANPEC